jgi:hypothetical protein
MGSGAEKVTVTEDALAHAMSVAELAVADDPELVALLAHPDADIRRRVRALALATLVDEELFEAHASPPWADTWPTPSVRLSAEEVGRLVGRGQADACALYLRPWRYSG